MSTDHTHRRLDRLTDVWLFVLAIKPLVLGGLLAASAFLIQPVLTALHLPAIVNMLIIVTMFMGGLFLVSWTWAAHISLPLGMRVVVATLLPVALLTSAYFKLVSGSKFLGVAGDVLTYFIAGLPILSVWLRSESGRQMRSLMPRPRA